MGLNEGLFWTLLITLVKIAVVLGIVLLHAAYTVYAERKIIGRMQARLGPTEVGPYGLLQPIADLVKLLFKEDIIPREAHRVIFQVAPLLVLIFAITNLSVIPFHPSFYIADVNLGVLVILAFAGLGTYGIILAGYSSGSRYSLLGGLRSAAQILSYEIPLGLSLAGVILYAESFKLQDIVASQASSLFGMNAIPQLLGFIVFLICAFAETNRAPFDLPEAESELVAGYITEYSGFRMGIFFLGEYISMYVMALLISLCYLGGWTLPFWLTGLLPFLKGIPPILILIVKVYFIIFLYIWVRATFPRYRFDQLMNMSWKVLIPLSLINFIWIAILKWGMLR
ncbi:NADH-quinone oxidoreductase [Caldimicrobium thiodismutans]|uniref:NADH-quinone oxidoreductase subunit H n=1 Tax=Caldimicrobium thiodismutans TaxID=1653476 RepID=A0A0U5AH69_9BACT|nr:NADH-quinone oxidoreductase subunit NuoH [Caldimicrobium thiodismutans]BAU23299.1 NADH-quinone oxidoreductase [Caldimicrobium thiodismutans]